MTIAEFLLARIAEDEGWAKAARGWQTGSRHEGQPLDRSIHMDHWSPDRALAECEAKRRIVEGHTIREVSPSCSECGGYTSTTDDARGIIHHGYAIPWPCPTLRLLALPYANHPDFREEWQA